MTDDGTAELAAYGDALAEAVDARLATWVVESVRRVMLAWAGRLPPDVAEAAEAAGRQARADIGQSLAHLLRSDLDDQRTTPLAILRQGVKYPTAVLRAAGVPPVSRDRFAEQAFPEDVYDLSPASLADFSPDLAELGISWGAAKAFVHRRLHGS